MNQVVFSRASSSSSTMLQQQQQPNHQRKYKQIRMIEQVIAEVEQGINGSNSFESKMDYLVRFREYLDEGDNFELAEFHPSLLKSLIAPLCKIVILNRSLLQREACLIVCRMAKVCGNHSSFGILADPLAKDLLPMTKSPIPMICESSMNALEALIDCTQTRGLPRFFALLISNCAADRDVVIRTNCVKLLTRCLQQWNSRTCTASLEKYAFSLGATLVKVLQDPDAGVRKQSLDTFSLFHARFPGAAEALLLLSGKLDESLLEKLRSVVLPSYVAASAPIVENPSNDARNVETGEDPSIKYSNGKLSQRQPLGMINQNTQQQRSSIPSTTKARKVIIMNGMTPNNKSNHHYRGTEESSELSTILYQCKEAGWMQRIKGLTALEDYIERIGADLMDGPNDESTTSTAIQISNTVIQSMIQILGDGIRDQRYQVAMASLDALACLLSYPEVHRGEISGAIYLDLFLPEVLLQLSNNKQEVRTCAESVMNASLLTFNKEVLLGFMIKLLVSSNKESCATYSSSSVVYQVKQVQQPVKIRIACASAILQTLPQSQSWMEANPSSFRNFLEFLLTQLQATSVGVHKQEEDYLKTILEELCIVLYDLIEEELFLHEIGQLSESSQNTFHQLFQLDDSGNNSNSNESKVEEEEVEDALVTGKKEEKSTKSSSPNVSSLQQIMEEASLLLANNKSPNGGDASFSSSKEKTKKNTSSLVRTGSRNRMTRSSSPFKKLSPAASSFSTSFVVAARSPSSAASSSSPLPTATTPSVTNEVAIASPPSAGKLLKELIEPMMSSSLELASSLKKKKNDMDVPIAIGFSSAKKKNSSMIQTNFNISQQHQDDEMAINNNNKSTLSEIRLSNRISTPRTSNASTVSSLLPDPPPIQYIPAILDSSSDKQLTGTGRKSEAADSLYSSSPIFYDSREENEECVENMGVDNDLSKILSSPSPQMNDNESMLLSKSAIKNNMVSSSSLIAAKTPVPSTLTSDEVVVSRTESAESAISSSSSVKKPRSVYPSTPKSASLIRSVLFSDSKHHQSSSQKTLASATPAAMNDSKHSLPSSSSKTKEQGKRRRRIDKILDLFTTENEENGGGSTVKHLRFVDGSNNNCNDEDSLFLSSLLTLLKEFAEANEDAEIMELKAKIEIPFKKLSLLLKSSNPDVRKTAIACFVQFSRIINSKDEMTQFLLKYLSIADKKLVEIFIKKSQNSFNFLA